LQEDNIQTSAASTPQDMIELYLFPSIKDYKLIYKIKNLDKEFNRYLPGLRNPKHINYEKEIIMATEEYRGLYDFIWNKCNGKEKYLLYNFARYGLMNFKNTVEIYLLLQKKILIIHDEEIKLFSVSFRAYVLRALPAEMVSTLNKKYQQNSAWHSFRTPFLIILLAIAAFIFFTQENTWQRIIALITGISSSIPFLLNTFSSNGSGGAAKK
ncbi:MAG TPA: hypothetical protein VFO70_06785, partial [Chitinophagaceae bacterium]|nr:hypothetical protein [Chitinophagaceae bacterium]